MGADLYLRSMMEKAHAEWAPRLRDATDRRDSLPAGPDRDAAQAEVDRCREHLVPDTGYFRDPYNGASVMRRLGLSWTDVETHGDWLAGDNLLRFRALVAERALPPTTLEDLTALRCHVDDDGSVERWHSYFQAQQNRLLALLDLAIELGEPIEVSL